MLLRLSLLKTEVKYLIIAKGFDIITTYIGITSGIVSEGNKLFKDLPLGIMLISNFLLIVIGAYLIQKINIGKAGMIFPIICIAPVFWNIYIIGLELMFIYF